MSMLNLASFQCQFNRFLEEPLDLGTILVNMWIDVACPRTRLWRYGF